jgi:phosphoribosylformylglycinamidine synthase
MIFPDTKITTLEIARSLNLSTEEYQNICKELGRAPNFAELGIFSAMYSEHCSYKSSKVFLKKFPTEGKRVIQGPGENAGILEVDDTWAVAFKMESHNHPSYIEPYQGAATGVGGILRDVFTMGARPIANMNCLFFGEPNAPRMKSIMKGVVKGIGDYGNCVGIPTVGGQTFFHECYNKNPLVNAFSLGLVKKENIYKGLAKGVDNFLVYVGAKTGRDGVHGASMASQEFSSEKELEKPTVQVGDPFTEKLLLEATLEVLENRLVVGIQDMGAAGITSSTFEMAYRAKTGLEVNLDEVPTRESNLSAFELLLSESQERMVLVCTPENFEKIHAIYEKWDLHAVKIGHVTATNHVVMFKSGEKVVDLPVSIVVNAPQIERSLTPPSDLKQRWFIDRNRILSGSLEAKFETLLSHVNFCKLSPITQQYDSTVGARTMGDIHTDASILRLRDITDKNLGLAFSTDCNPRISWLDPKEGGKRAIAEAAINLSVRGAEPIGVTDCLNFGSPENPEVLWQLEQSVLGISEACRALKIPVISGNVSLYNETDQKPIYPTPMIGMVGILENPEKTVKSNFYSTELEIGILGPKEGGLGGSVLASLWFKRECGKPEDTDLGLVERVAKCCQSLRSHKVDYSCHDISDGGLVTALLEMAFYSPHKEIGIEVQVPHDVDMDRFLFGETIPRILIAYAPSDRTLIENHTRKYGIELHKIGTTHDQSQFVVYQGFAKVLIANMLDLKTKWATRLESIFNS